MPETVPEARSLPQLVSDLASDLSTLVRKEIELARAELGDKLTRLRNAAIEGAAGAILILFGALFLLQALALALAELIGLGWAYVVVGAGLILLGGLAFLLSRRSAPDQLALERSGEQLKETVRVAREQAP